MLLRPPHHHTTRPIPGRRLVRCAAALMAVVALALTGPGPEDEGKGKAGEMSLRVVDQKTGAPVAGVAVKTRADGKSAKATTDADGRCRLALPEKAPSFFAVWADK